MSNAETITELREMNDDELIEKHDELAKATVVGTQHYLQEIYRRDQERVAEKMLHYTKWIGVMTGVVTIATIVNVIIIFCR